MRTLLIVAWSTLALGCAHRETHNLTQRQTTTPHSDFDGAHRDEYGKRRAPPVEPPIVTPPIP